MAGSVSTWIVGLKAGEAEAIGNLWNRYSKELARQARLRIGNGARQLADEDDVVVSVFDTICRGAAAGRFENLADRDDLWWLLLALTRSKSVDHQRRENRDKRGGGRVILASDLAGSNESFDLSQVIGDSPTPELLATMDEEYHRLLGLLRDDQLRSVAICRLEGMQVQEISAKLDLSLRSVERKLQLIRNKWSSEIER